MNKLLNEIKSVVSSEFAKEKFGVFQNIEIVDNTVSLDDNCSVFTFSIRDGLCYWAVECNGSEWEFGGETVEEVMKDPKDWLTCMMGDVWDISMDDDQDEW
jgi:hypothetical protein